MHVNFGGRVDHVDLYGARYDDKHLSVSTLGRYFDLVDVLLEKPMLQKETELTPQKKKTYENR